MKIFSSLRRVGLALAAVITTAGASPTVVFAQEHLAVLPSQVITAPTKLSDSQIGNFARIAPGITRGAQPSDKAISQMAQDGVKTIIDLRMNGSGTANEEALTHKAGMKYVHIPMMLVSPTDQQVAQFLSVVNDPANLPVFIHCRQGADRTGTLCGIYRRKVQGWNFEQTYAEMREHHFKPFLFGMKDLVKNCPNQKFEMQAAVAEVAPVAPTMSASAVSTASVATTGAPPVVADQKPSDAEVIAKVHHDSKIMAGDMPPVGTMMMTVDQ